MTTAQELPYELRLCIELLHYAGIASPRCQEMTASEIKAAVAVFFDPELVDHASDILCGRAPRPVNVPPGPPPAASTEPHTQDHFEENE